MVFANQGAAVVVNDIIADNAEAVVKQIVDSDGRAVVNVSDISIAANAEKLINFAVEEFGRIDILVNNAGILLQGPFLEMDESDFDRCVAVDFKSVWACSKAALPHMIKQRYGRIINVGSNAGKRGNPTEVIYSGIKAGVMAMTKAMAAEFGEYNITVNAICPKAWTAMEKVNTPVRPAKYNAPVPRVGDPEKDIAPAIVFLASEQAGYVTAQLLGVDGGIYR